VPVASLSTATTVTTPTLKTQACQGLAKIHSSLGNLATNVKTATVGQAKAAQQKLATAAANLDAKIPKSDTPLLDNLQTAIANLGNTLSAYPDKTMLAEVLPKQPGYEEAVARAQAAQGKLSSRLQCSA
jgi:hypothetical protein